MRKSQKPSVLRAARGLSNRLASPCKGVFPNSLVRCGRFVAVFLFASILSACGGGGSNDSGAGTGTPKASATLTPNSIVVDSTQSTKITSISVTPDGTQQIAFSPDSSIASSLKEGEVLNILAGSDERFPLGLAGKISGIARSSDGATIVNLAPVSLAEIVTTSTSQATDIPLTSENFIGVIAPPRGSAESG